MNCKSIVKPTDLLTHW